jgi:trans-aconitate methyltransferase
VTDNWKGVWDRRSIEGGNSLDELVRIDGFDAGAGRIEVADWRAYASVIAQKLGLKDGDSVYEVGCGAGAYLYALRENCTLRVGGLDFSRPLIAAAAQVMPDGDFTLSEAGALETSPHYDYVIANSVFHYLELDSAANVLGRMITKCKAAVAVLEVPDLQTKQESEALRRESLAPQEYENKYAGLKHTYYERAWFVEQAAARGLDCELFDGCIPNYPQNRFRFGCIIRKS